MLLAQQGSYATIIVAVIVVLFFLTAGIMLLVFARISGLWMQAYMAHTPVMMLEIIGMMFRKVDVKAVIKALIMAKQSGVVLSREELERAYLQGADLEKLTLAMIRAKQEDAKITFQELVDADVNDRLAEKLNLK